MSNETYLQVSYFAMIAGSLLLGGLTFLLLRRQFHAVCAEAPRSLLAPAARRLYLLGLTIPPLLGFFSVSYFSCDMNTYTKIVADRAYLIHVNQLQAQSVLQYLTAALIGWCLVVFALVFTSRR